MPGRDRTGPRGFGSLTGRGAGDCAEQEIPEFANRYAGFGRRFGGHFGARGAGWFGGRCGGHGWRRHFHGYSCAARGGDDAPSTDQVLAEMKAAAAEMERDLDAINRRIEELEQK